MWLPLGRMWMGLVRILLLLMPVSPPSPLHADDHLLLRYYAAIFRVLQPVFCQVLQILTKKTSNFKDELSSLNGFFEEEKNLLNANCPCAKFDISLLYKLIRRLRSCNFDKRQKNVAGTLEYNLERLSQHRNDLAHKDLDLSGGELQRRIEDIKSLSRDTLMMVELKSGTPVQSHIQHMEDGLQHVITGTWEMYREALRSLRQERRNVIVRKGKKELEQIAQRLRILNPFAWLTEDQFRYMDINQIFTDVHIKGLHSVKTQDIFSATHTSGDLPPALVIHGTPGIGKTSLVRFLLQDWLSSSPSVIGLESFELVIPVELRNIASNSVQQLLREQLLPETCRHFQNEDIIPTLQEVSTLWLIDGYDEAGPERAKVMEELFLKFPSSRFVVTTRTELEKELHLVLSNHHLNPLVLEITGFLPDKITQHVQKLYTVYSQNQSTDASYCNKLISYIDGLQGSLLILFCVPLYLVFLFIIWMENPAQVQEAKTITRLYQTLVSHIINSMCKRKVFKMQGVTERQLKRKIEEVLNKVGDIFWENQSNYQHSLLDDQVDQLEDLCGKLGLPFQECMSPFFRITVKTSTAGTVEIYEPLHRTLQEFLAARSFCNEMIMRNSDILTLASERNENNKKRKKTVHYNLFSKSVYFREQFSIEKLCEAKTSLFEEYQIIEPSNMVTLFSCHPHDHPHYPSADDIEEFERSNVNGYFHRIFWASPVPKFMVGLLKLRNELNKARSEQIVYICHCVHEGVSQYGLWLNLIKESKEDDLLLEELRSQISPFMWDSEPSLWKCMTELMEYIVPISVRIHSCGERDISYIDSQTVDTVRQISKYSVDIILDFRTLMLHNYDEHFRLCKECIRVTLDERASCRLTVLCCKVDGEVLGHLRKAQWLEELSVKLDTLEDLHILAQVIPEFPRLTNVAILPEIVLKDYPPKCLPTLHTQKTLQVKRQTSLVSLKVECSPSFLTFDDEGSIMAPHACKHPSVISCKTNIRHSKRKHSQRKVAADSIQHPGCITSFRRRQLHHFGKELRLPDVHCHHQCSRESPLPEICSGKCCHSYSTFDQIEYPTVPTPFPRTKEMWTHHQTAISYHRWSMRRLRSIYKELCKFSLSVQEKRASLAIKLCKLCMHQHRISVQQHQRFLTSTYLKRNKGVAPFSLVILDPFRLSPIDLAVRVKKLCPNLGALFLHGHVNEDCSPEDLAEYVWQLAAHLPKICELGIEIPFDIYDQLLRIKYDHMIHQVKVLIESSGPLFNLDIHTCE